MIELLVPGIQPAGVQCWETPSYMYYTDRGIYELHRGALRQVRREDIIGESAGCMRNVIHLFNVSSIPIARDCVKYDVQVRTLRGTMYEVWRSEHGQTSVRVPNGAPEPPGWLMDSLRGRIENGS